MEQRSSGRELLPGEGVRHRVRVNLVSLVVQVSVGVWYSSQLFPWEGLSLLVLRQREESSREGRRGTGLLW